MKQNPITEIPSPSSTSNNKMAIACRDQYPVALAKITVCYPWRFARKMATLTRTASTVSFYTYSFALPSDMERVNVLLDAEGLPVSTPCDVVGPAILSDEEAVVLNYGASQALTANIPPHVAAVVALQLADDLSAYLEDDRPADHAQRLAGALRTAKQVDAQSSVQVYGTPDSTNSAISLFM